MHDVSPPSFVTAAGQVRHDAWPARFVYVPAAHGAQSVAITPAATVVPNEPAEHMLHELMPPAFVVRKGQAMHTDVIPVAVLYVPTAQGVPGKGAEFVGGAARSSGLVSVSVATHAGAARGRGRAR